MTKKYKPRLDSVGRKRLHKLADLLEANAANKRGIKFDMQTWGSAYEPQKDPVSCGTKACAMGLAALSGAFKRAGLDGSLKKKVSMFSDVDYEIKFKWNGKNVDGVAAAKKLFGMSWGNANDLFVRWPSGMEAGAKAERQMAKRLRNFADGKPVQIDDHTQLIDDIYVYKYNI